MIWKKGQEEIVGFVLIVVIMAVVFVILLGIYLRSPSENVIESRDVSQFLDSSMEQTTDCVTSFYPDYRKLGELFEECLSNETCLDERDTCDVLNENLIKVIESGWKIDELGPFVGYEFVSKYKQSNDEPVEILSFSSGSCNGTIRGASYVTPVLPGSIESVLKICS